jgi:hypothetical protein
MAHTYALQGKYRDVWGSRNVRKTNITLVDNYATGGWPLTAQDMGFGRTAQIEFVIPLTQGVGAVFSWDDVNKKLMARDWAGAEIANASAALAGTVIQCLVGATGAHT